MALPRKENVTYADYISWDEDVRCEVLDGRVISLNFSPSKKHQDILGNLYMTLRQHFEGKRCSVMMAPFDVCLFADAMEINLKRTGFSVRPISLWKYCHLPMLKMTKFIK